MAVSRYWRGAVAGLALVAAGTTTPAQDPPAPTPPAATGQITGPIIHDGPWSHAWGDAWSAPPTWHQDGSGTCCPDHVHRSGCLSNPDRLRLKQARYLGYPEEWCARPLGWSLYTHNRTMVANGTAARLALYQYDFIEGTSQLNWRGRDQLAKLAAILVENPNPLVIERTLDNPNLAESRRYQVLAELAASPYPVSSDRVIVGVPVALGMRGIEAVIVDSTRIGRVGAYGPGVLLEAGGATSGGGGGDPSQGIGR